MDETGNSMQIVSDTQLQVLNENHLLEAMGLTQTNEEELSTIFSPELNEYLKSQTFICREKSTEQRI